MTENLKGLTHWVKIATEVGIILFAVGIAWATLTEKVQRSEETIKKDDVRITRLEEHIANVNADIREIKVEQKYILQGVQEIKASLKQP